EADPAPDSWVAYFNLFKHWLIGLLKPIWAPILWLAAKIWLAFQTPLIVPPAVRSAIDALAVNGVMVARPGDRSITQIVIDIFAWIGNHHDELVDALDVVLEAVQEAERFGEMSGPDKRVYARDLI